MQVENKISQFDFLIGNGALSVNQPSLDGLTASEIFKFKESKSEPFKEPKVHKVSTPSLDVKISINNRLKSEMDFLEITQIDGVPSLEIGTILTSEQIHLIYKTIREKRNKKSLEERKAKLDGISMNIPSDWCKVISKTNIESLILDGKQAILEKYFDGSFIKIKDFKDAFKPSMFIYKGICYHKDYGYNYFKLDGLFLVVYSDKRELRFSFGFSKLLERRNVGSFLESLGFEYKPSYSLPYKENDYIKNEKEKAIKKAEKLIKDGKHNKHAIETNAKVRVLNEIKKTLKES